MKQLKGNRSCLFVCLAVLAASPVFAASITVTNTNDNGAGSLRDAIDNAAPGDTINFNLTYPATITLSSTLPIGTSLTISGPGASNLAVSGGGSVQVFSIGSGVTATISGVTIKNGSAPFGGGISNEGTLTISDSALSGNRATGEGGGIFNGSGLTVNNSTLSGNSAFDGGGISNLGGVTVTNCTLSGNSAAQFGGGISSLATSGSVDVTNSTLSGNSASVGGGLFSGGLLAVTNGTLSGNSAGIGGGIANVGTLLAKTTIVANTISGGNCYPGIAAFSFGHNLSDDATCAFYQASDLNSTPSGLDPNGLQDNGGPTQTIALVVTSPAVDAVPVSPTNDCTALDGVTPVSTDQRGVARPQGFGCDIGAYERKGFSSFSANLELGSGKQGGFSLNAAFTVSAGSAPIDPVTQAVRLNIGPYMVTIPAGSFHQAQGSNTGSWAFAGSIGGVKLTVQIAALGGGSYQFKATGSPVDFSGVSNPVSVAIGIGVDAGSTQVSASF